MPPRAPRVAVLGAGTIGLDAHLQPIARSPALHEQSTMRHRVVAIARDGRPCELSADHLIALTGTSETTIYRQHQIHEYDATAAPMNLSAAVLGAASADCLAQPDPGADAIANPKPGFPILGAKSYGRMNTFRLRTGYEHVDRPQARLQASRA